MDLPPHIVNLDGERSARFVDRLARFESPAFTARRARRSEELGAKNDPIVWASAQGVNVTDVDGNRFVDLTSGFGVASLGHRHPEVVAAIHAQSETLLHALGDLHPSDVKIDLLEALCEMVPFDARAVLSLNGSDAVETALKTALIHTQRPGIIAFEGGYHGLALGPLATCGYSAAFRAPFEAHLHDHVQFAPWPTALEELDDLAPAIREAGCVIIEPIQGRGGVRPLVAGGLERLRALCEENGTLLIVDEIFTGLGRCGAMHLSEDHADLICFGKALGGGLPISACVGRADVMSSWGHPDGEAIHTGTFFGHPLASAAALASLAVLRRDGLCERAVALGDLFRRELGQRNVATRGQGLMLGVPLSEPGAALHVSRALLSRGYLALPAGAHADVLQLVPPIVMRDETARAFCDALADVLERA